MLKWLIERVPTLMSQYNALSNAASLGNIEIMSYLLDEVRCKYEETPFESPMLTAAKHGHLKLVKWFRACGYRWTLRLCTLAAKYGHLHVLKWAVENGCDCDVQQTKLAAYGESTAYTGSEICSWLDKRLSV